MMRPRLMVIAVLIVLIATWPTLIGLANAVPGEKLTSTYGVYRSALLRPPWEWLNLNFDNANFPTGGRGVVLAIPQFLVAALFAPLVGETAALNLSLLLHLAGGVVAAGALGRWAAPDGGEWAGAVAGLSVGLGCFGLGVWANGQPESVGIVYVSCAIGLGLAWLRKGGMLLFVGSLGAVALAMLSSPYLVMGPLLGSPVGLLLLWEAHGARRVATLAAATATTLLLVALPYRATLDARENGQIMCPAALSYDAPADSTLDLSDLDWRRIATPPPLSDPNVADPLAMILPLNLSGRVDEVSIVYIGATVLLFAAWGLVRAPARVAWMWSAALAPLLLALGPQLRLGGWVLLDHGATVWLPLAWLDELPAIGALFRTIQVPARLVFGAALPLGIAAAIGVARLPARLRPWAAALVVAEVLIASPARPPARMWSVAPPDAYTWLAQQTDRDAVVDAPPLGFTRSPPTAPPITWTRSLWGRSGFHGHPVPYTGCYPPLLNPRILRSAFALALERVAAGEPAGDLQAEGAALRAIGVGWVVWHPRSGVAPENVAVRVEAELTAAFPLVFVGGDGTEVFRLPERSAEDRENAPLTGP